MDLPIVIEIVDTEENILMFLAAVEPIVDDELITLEKVQAIFYRGKSS
jgi:PII-like signaling protein